MDEKESCQALGIDQACLYINSVVNATFSKQYDECIQCPFIDPRPIVAGLNNNSFVIDTRYPAKFLIEVENSSCVVSGHLREYGEYKLDVTTCNETERDSCLSCTSLVAITVPAAVDAYIPIIVAVCIYVGLVLFYFGALYMYRIVVRIFNRTVRSDSMEDVLHGNSDPSMSSADHLSPSSLNDPHLANPAPKRERLRSLDTFRGISLATMIFVNYGAGKYWFFHHSRWNGLTVADLVFPWFIWIMGMSMSMSLRSLVRRATPKPRIAWKIIKRTIILFALGLILNTSYGANDMTKLRIPGVLQRFAISYFVVGIVHMFFAKPEDSHTESRWASVRDVFIYWGEWLIMLSLLTIYLCIIFLLPVPDCPTGYLGPGGLHENGSHRNCTGGASGYIDRKFFGLKHIYANPTCKELYHTPVPYDPEGLLGSITSIFLVFLGLQAGKIIQTYKCWKARIIRFLAWSIITGVIAAILCKGSKNDGWIPVNKNLWSLSYILTTGSMAFFLLSACLYFQDVKKWWNGSPFFFAGMNSILLYVGHQLTGTLFPWQFKAPNTHAAQLAMDLWGASLWVFISYVLYRKQVFLAI